MKKREFPEEAQRVLRFIEKSGSVDRQEFGTSDDSRLLLVVARGGRKLLCNRSTWEALTRVFLIEPSNNRFVVSALGLKRLKRSDGHGNAQAFDQQHRLIVAETIEINEIRHTVSRNLNESPLERLRSRKDGQGRPWLSEAAYGAGERLRRDFTLSHFEQSITSNWSSFSSALQAGPACGRMEVSDVALDARRRLSEALQCVGPDLAGLLTDICCFLKGLQTIERERRWPARSAKLMLRTGLDLLAGHYGTTAGARPLNPRMAGNSSGAKQALHPLERRQLKPSQASIPQSS